MKKINFVSVIVILMLFAFGKSGWAAEAPYIAPISDQTATLGELFNYQVMAVNADPAETYELLAGRPGMTINPASGVISWTPATTSDGGTVTVRAYNSAGESVRTFVVYISDAIVCDEDLISYWKLDEPTGDVYEDFQGGYTATSLTSLTNVAGVVDNGKTFSPLGKTDQFIYVTDEGQYDFARTGGFSVSLWFKYEGQYLGGDPVNQVLVARGSPEDYDEMLYMIMVDVSSGSPKVTYSLRPKVAGQIKNVTSPTIITTGEWYHVVAVFQGAPSGQQSEVNLYVNTARSTGPHEFPPADFVGDGRFDLNIGYWDKYEASRFCFNGSMDEILVYGKALTGTDVNTIYNDGYSGKAHCKPGNYYPLFSSVPVTAAAQDVEYSYTVTASDFDNDPLTLSAEILPSWLTFNAASGLLSGTPSSADVGIFPVSIKATDGSIEIFQNFDIDVTNTNDPPVFTSTPITEATEEVAYTYFVEVEDLDDDPLVFTTPVLPSWLTFNPSTQVLIGIPKRSDAGDNPVEIVVSDGVFQVSQEFTIVVASDNNAPIFTSIPVTEVDNYEEYEYTVTAFDADATDVLTFSPEIIPAWTFFDAETGMLTGTPAKNHVGDHPVSLIVSDGWVDVKQEFVITVRDVNTPPVINSTPNDSAMVDELYAYLMDVTDNDGDPLVYTGIIIPDWMTFSSASKVLSGTPSTDDLGKHNVMITVSDGTFTINHLFEITVVNLTSISISNKLVNSIYPNPADDYVVFEFVEQASSIEITDLAGKVLIRENISTGDLNIQINVSELNNGMYMFRVFDETKSQHQTGKIVIN